MGKGVIGGTLFHHRSTVIAVSSRQDPHNVSELMPRPSTSNVCELGVGHKRNRDLISSRAQQPVRELSQADTKRNCPKAQANQSKAHL